MTTDEDRTPAAWRFALAFAILYVVWGTTYLAIQIGVKDQNLPPFYFGGCRIGLAGVILLLIQIARGQSLGVSRQDLPGLLVGASLLFVVGNGLISLALKYVQSGESAVLAATATLWIALFSALFRGGDRIRPLAWLGILVGLAGVAVLQGPKIRQQGGFAFLDNIGPWLVLASAAAWGIGSVVLRQFPVRMPRTTSAGYQMFLGGAGMIALGALLGETPPPEITPSVAVVFVYLLVFGSLIAFVAFNWLLEHVSAPKVGTYAYVNPLVAVLLGTWLHGEPLTWSLAAGMGLILAAVFLVRGGNHAFKTNEKPADDAAWIARPASPTSTDTLTACPNSRT